MLKQRLMAAANICAAVSFLMLVSFVQDSRAQETQNDKLGQKELSKQFVDVASAYIPEAANFEFKAKRNSFGHLAKPWATSQRILAGRFSISPERFLLSEASQRGSRSYETNLSYSSEMLCERDEAGRLEDVSVSEHRTFLRSSGRYSPAVLLQHLRQQIAGMTDDEQLDRLKFRRQGDGLVAAGVHGDENYEVHFSKDSVLTKVVWIRTHEMWGDQTLEFEYSREKKDGQLTYPRTIIEKTFGVVTFQTEVVAKVKGSAMELAEFKIPADYQLEPESSTTTDSEIEVEKYSDHVTLLNLPHCDSRSLLIEFRDFLMVVDAPINSANGQLILDKIDEMELGKPVKYFAFGHHHPHYLGGVRPFVARGATVLSTEKTAPYVKQLAGFQHSRLPDELQRDPKDVTLQTFEGEVEIGDGEYVVKIFDIGEKSKHTNDYLLFYFPNKKMLFQDDGIWLRANQPTNERTRATYRAIIDLKLDINDCIQGWPTQNYGVRTKVKFEELKTAIDKDLQKEQADRDGRE